MQKPHEQKYPASKTYRLRNAPRFPTLAWKLFQNYQKELADFSKALGGAAEDRAEELNKVKAAALEYQARVDLGGMLIQIEKSITAAISVKNAQTVLRKFRATLRSLTDAAKAASSEILNAGFVARFDEECRRSTPQQ